MTGLRPLGAGVRFSGYDSQIVRGGRGGLLGCSAHRARSSAVDAMLVGAVPGEVARGACQGCTGLGSEEVLVRVVPGRLVERCSSGLYRVRLWQCGHDRLVIESIADKRDETSRSGEGIGTSTRFVRSVSERVQLPDCHERKG